MGVRWDFRYYDTHLKTSSAEVCVNLQSSPLTSLSAFFFTLIFLCFKHRLTVKCSMASLQYIRLCLFHISRFTRQTHSICWSVQSKADHSWLFYKLYSNKIIYNVLLTPPWHASQAAVIYTAAINKYLWYIPLLHILLSISKRLRSAFFQMLIEKRSI